MIWYMDAENNPVAKLHRFIDAEGAVLASGRPDPKSLIDGGVKFVCFVETHELPISMHLWASVNALWSQLCKWLDCASVKLLGR
ncbi:MAG: hypothetical protein CMLOHMNK_00273 [Steroidobacteraceae bacterium]|nr:hypothetical protein [Steroidobacteraceae bacterium]